MSRDALAKTPENGKDEVARLVDHYKRNIDQFRLKTYKEANARMELIDPLFSALGWDLSNLKGAAPQYREVLVEASQEVEGHKKAPDYVFRVGQSSKFFLEAKKPIVPIKSDSAPSFQLKRYAWSAKLPVSVLTNFETFSVYDCRFRPKDTDKADKGRSNIFTFEQYPDRWDEIWNIFSRDAVWSGAFDEFANRSKSKKGTGQVDDEFLKEIEGWRDSLAKNFAAKNPKFSVDDLNEVVQKTIDRIIFLRMAEDRGVEPFEQLKHLAQGSDIYEEFINRLCRKADEKYNSGLFDSEKDKVGRNAILEDKVLKGIISDLYFPKSPYEFSVLPPEILGNVYEQFLGKVIRLTENHHAKIEAKPEVKAAGGVFYTPSYIVDYIVKNTVGRQIADKSPKDLVGFKVVDVACGSGSFLLGAYKFLLDHYLEWYLANKPEKYPKAVWKNNAAWRLSTAEKKRILTLHIYGVDIDRQAVEVSKLSLLLKVLEGENEETLGKQMLLFHERSLPDLDSNIKCGNSLIEPSYFSGRLILDTAEMRRVNPFDWQGEFPTVFRDGGFDCVIGNPPYIRIQTMKEWAPLEVEIYKEEFISAGSGNYDIYVVMVEKGLKILKREGCLGFILPHKFFNAQYGKALRQLIADGKYLTAIVHFGAEQVFDKATTYTCLLFLGKAGSDTCKVQVVNDLEAWRSRGTSKGGEVRASSITGAEWNFSVGKEAELLTKLSRFPLKLSDATSRIFQGVKTSSDKIFIVEEVMRKGADVKVYSKEKETEYWLEAALLHPLIKGGDSRLFHMSRTNRLILFPYLKSEGKSRLVDAKVMKKSYPLTWKYLCDNKTTLEEREDGKFAGENWYMFGRSQALDVMPLPKIFTPDISLRPSFSLDESGEVFFTGGVSGGYGILVRPEFNREYVLGLLNSKVTDWYIRMTSTQMRGNYYSFESRYIQSIPLPSGRKETSKDDVAKVAGLVKRLIELQGRKEKSSGGSDKEVLHRQIGAVTREMESVIFCLYGLSSSEVKVIEEGIV